MKLKFFQKDESGFRNFIEWKSGYISLHNDWLQFLNPKTFNWITFRIFNLEFELDRLCDVRFEISFSFLGLGFYFQQFIKENSKGKSIRREVAEMKSSEALHQIQTIRLKNKIKELKNVVQRLSTEK